MRRSLPYPGRGVASTAELLTGATGQASAGPTVSRLTSDCCYAKYFMEPVGFPPRWSKGAFCYSEPRLHRGEERLKRSFSRPPAQRWFFWGFPQTPAPSPNSGQAPGDCPFGNPHQERYFDTNHIAGKLATVPTPPKRKRYRPTDTTALRYPGKGPTTLDHALFPLGA